MQGVNYGFSIFNNCHSRNTNLLSQLHLKFFSVQCKYSYYCENYMQKVWYTSQLLIEMLCEFGCWGSIWYFYHGKFGIVLFQRDFFFKYMLPLQLSIYPFPTHPFLNPTKVTTMAYSMQEGGFLCSKVMNSTAKIEILPLFLYF